MNNERPKSKIFLVDDNPVVLESLKKLLNRQEDLIVCGESETGNGALKAIPMERPDLAIVDLSLQDMNGLDLIKVLMNENQWLRILVHSMHDELVYGEAAVKAGAKGYLMKQLSVLDILKAVRSILHGDRYLSDQLRKQIETSDENGKFKTGI